MGTVNRRLVAREILLGFWKVHILHHAAEHPVVGQWILEELRRHGYDISPGTLYPLLKRMERNGWLRCETDAGAGPRSRRYYHLTSGGRAVLKIARAMVRELHREVAEGDERHTPSKLASGRAGSGSRDVVARRQPPRIGAAGSQRAQAGSVRRGGTTVRPPRHHR